jgi:glycosyltransferase involved in cell wall biosynthesis
MSRRVLLTVSGAVPDDLDEQIRRGSRPRPDFTEMARAFDADILDRTEARRSSGRLMRLVGRVLGDDILMAWSCFRRRRCYDLIFTDGEQVGLPLAALLHLTPFDRPRHLMIVHILSVPKKVVPFRLLRLGTRIDRLFVYATAQERFVVERLRYPHERVVLTPFMVDSRFFVPQDAQGDGRSLIASAGLEFRDYPTLIDAVRGLDVHVVLAAASPWSRRRDTSSDRELPENVEVRRLDLADLRTLYASADLIVVPVVETDFQAGITTILEAMSMGKPLICTRTVGQTDTVIDGETGVYVPPRDIASLRAAIQHLLDDPERSARLGTSARRWVEQHADIETYAQRLASVVDTELAKGRHG